MKSVFLLLLAAVTGIAAPPALVQAGARSCQELAHVSAAFNAESATYSLLAPTRNFL